VHLHAAHVGINVTTSGTTTFNLDIVDMIEEAYEMVGKEVRGGYDVKTARRSLDLLTKEWANRGINFWTIAEVHVPIISGQQTITLEDDTIDVLDAVWRRHDSTAAQNDMSLTRMSVKEWAQTSNKLTPSLPSRFWINRTVPPVMTLWPVPFQDGVLVYYKLRRMEDAGAYTNTMDVPLRFLPAMTSGLAYYLAIKTVGADNRIPILQAEYERQFRLAAEEDRERASLMLLPGVRRV
jgi:hypothetical protein